MQVHGSALEKGLGATLSQVTAIFREYFMQLESESEVRDGAWIVILLTSSDDGGSWLQYHCPELARFAEFHTSCT